MLQQIPQSVIDAMAAGTRHELRDHAFGDREVTWVNERGEEIATGYFSGTLAEVWFKDGDIHFDHERARTLADLGMLGSQDRNDEAGPQTYTEGAIMPGLTKEAVYNELTREVD